MGAAPRRATPAARCRRRWAARRRAIRADHALAIDAERVRLTKDYLAIHNPPLHAGLAAADQPESIAFEPRLVVVHYTAIPTLAGTLEAFAGLHIGPDRELIRRNGLLNVGIQFVVDRDGTIHALYPETVIARHVIGLNHVAIGIENVGDGDLPARWLPGRRRAEAPLTPPSWRPTSPWCAIWRGATRRSATSSAIPSTAGWSAPPIRRTGSSTRSCPATAPRRAIPAAAS